MVFFWGGEGVLLMGDKSKHLSPLKPNIHIFFSSNINVISEVSTTIIVLIRNFGLLSDAEKNINNTKLLT